MNEPDNQKLQVLEYIGDLFDAPANTLIVHACNCQGSWSAGIAKEFKERYPHAYTDYIYKCIHNKHSLLGKSHIILPINLSSCTTVSEDMSIEEQNESNLRKHFIGCVFTSYFYGKLKDSPSEVLKATSSSITNLLEQITVWNRIVEDTNKIYEVRMCKINSGLFNVPWRHTREVLESIDVSSSTIKVIKIVSLA